MKVQHLLLRRNGENIIIEEDRLRSHLVVPVPTERGGPGKLVSFAGRHVKVDRYFLDGEYYAIAIERNTSNHEIESAIRSSGISPIP